ncbi:MAG: hypothetical protein JXR30_01595 [Alphaproteobacteria bacterium]|nr:hypothetical protein [Alphaproteobacteria bacterium]
MNRLISFLLSLFIIGSMIVSLFLSFGIAKALWTQDLFNVLPYFVKKKEGIAQFHTFPVSPDLMSEDQKKVIKSRLIQDFITYYYTIHPDSNLMEKNLGLWWTDGDHKRVPENAPYFLWTMSEKSDVWEKISDKVAGYHTSVMKMVQEGKTQSVEILSPPHKSLRSDFWETYIKLYVLNPDDSISTQFLTIQMEVELDDSLRGQSYTDLYPATLFRFHVKQFKEIFAGHQN